jgi:hypothetical protein
MRVISGSSAWKLLKTFSNCGNHEHVHDDHRRDHRDDDERRIAQRRLHALAHVAVEFEVVEQAQEDFFQAAGHLAHAHHRQVERREHVRVAAHRHRQFAAGVERFAQVADHAREALVDGRLLQAGQAAHDRHAGFQQRVDLAAEQLDVERRDLLSVRRSHRPLRARPTPGVAALRVVGADLERRDAGAEQLVGHGAAVGAFQHALHQFAARVAALVSEKNGTLSPRAGY